ncbi:ATP-binding protein [Haloprofundus halophilus]|uniref:ATP-binding protein n=1 Tax=Haloprofundus halophilus TaxID=2283527 RepID=UPI000E444415|nr:ATP-binding protein [Haloprofundus halophilus]
MTHIDYLRVSGFKAVEYLEFEPSEINLITGRNNMGKTSFLQSADLVFNPSNITRFSKHLDKIVHENSDSASIESRFSRRQQTLDEFSLKDGKRGKHRELGLREPTENEVVRSFSKTVEEVLQLNEQYPVRISNSIMERMGIEDRDTFSETLQDILHESVTEISEELILSNMSKDLIIVEIEGDTYPYIHLGSGFDRLRSIIINHSVKKLQNQFNIDSEERGESNRQRYTNLHYSFRGFLTPRFGGDRFVGEDPPKIDGINLISNPIADPEKLDLSQENAAVRTSDIEDYLKESGIVENLEDFAFDRLVFKEDSEKGEIPYDFMGDGFKTIVGILWELFDEQKQGDVLLLEEPDVHMHPGYVENLIRQLIEINQEKDIQLFITTHNIDMIEGFFSPSLNRTHGDYLEENFRLLQLSGSVPKSLSYQQSKDEVEQVGSDLRGI